MMTTLFETVAAQARPQFYDIFGSSANFVQGSNSVAISMIKSNPGDRMKSEEEVLVWASFIEFVCKTSDLGGRIPARGNTIEQGGSTWRVLSPSELMPVWEFVDSEEMEVRIFCKLVE
jgi:hypothetical protein